MPEHDQDTIYDLRPPILVFADTDKGLADTCSMVERTGARIGIARRLETALSCLDDQVDIGALVLDVRNDDDPVLYRLLDRLDLNARECRHASVVLLRNAMIDAVVSHSAHPDVELITDTSIEEQCAALERAVARSSSWNPHMAESPRDPIQLMQLSEEVGRIAKTLATLSGIEETLPEDNAGKGEKLTAATVRTMIRARRLREQFFDPTLFADPAWDMLLDLMAARLEKRPVAVSSLCIAAAVPPTTALRWMKQLTDMGLLVRVADPHDGRRIFIELSDDAAAGITSFFNAFARMATLVN